MEGNSQCNSGEPETGSGGETPKGAIDQCHQHPRTRPSASLVVNSSAGVSLFSVTTFCLTEQDSTDHEGNWFSFHYGSEYSGFSVTRGNTVETYNCVRCPICLTSLVNISLTTFILPFLPVYILSCQYISVGFPSKFHDSY